MITISEDTKFSLSPKNFFTILVLVSGFVGMYYTLQADIQEAKELPKNEWVEDWDAKVDERIPEPDVTRMEFDMKDQMVRQTIMTTQEDVSEMKEDLKRIEEKLDELR